MQIHMISELQGPGFKSLPTQYQKQKTPALLSLFQQIGLLVELARASATYIDRTHV
jgi:hypothetical protein